MSHCIQVKALRKKYQKHPVVNGVDLTFQSGEIVGLLGPNGAGKTTCFYLILGLIESDAGDILLDGHSIEKWPVHKRARAGFGYLPQENSIFRKLTVAENILALLEFRTDLSRSEREASLESLLNEFNLQPIRHTLGLRLSGGERRRVEIARTLAADPKFIFLDEPFAGVDPISIQDIQTLILTLKRRAIGIIISDHNVRETLKICDRSYILHQGQVIAEGSLQVILSHEEVKAVYLGDDFAQ